MHVVTDADYILNLAALCHQKKYLNIPIKNQTQVL